MEPHTPDIMALIAQAPWREAVTYQDTWPHEYVVVKEDGQQELLAAFCGLIAQGEGVECRFFHQKREYLSRLRRVSPPVGLEPIEGDRDRPS